MATLGGSGLPWLAVSAAAHSLPRRREIAVNVFWIANMNIVSSLSWVTLWGVTKLCILLPPTFFLMNC